MKLLFNSILLLSHLISPYISISDLTYSLNPLCPDPLIACPIRTFYISADEVDWDYAPSGFDRLANIPLSASSASIYTSRYTNRIGAIYKKAIYREYTSNFTSLMSVEKWNGNLGPIIRAEVGDLIHVIFKNNATIPYSMHPHGVKYTKSNEGADYFMNDAKVLPGQTKEYTWQVVERSGPGPADGNVVCWGYHSHLEGPGEIYTGLVGAILVYRKGILGVDHLPTDIPKEFILNFLIYNENQSPYIFPNIRQYAPELIPILPNDPLNYEITGDEAWLESNRMHSINARVFGNLDGLEMSLNETVRWHLMAFGNEVDIHTVHWHGMSVLEEGRRRDVVDLLPSSFRTVVGTADSRGTWLVHCHVMDHQMSGMSAFFRVRTPDDTHLSLSAFIVDKNITGLVEDGSMPIVAKRKDRVFVKGSSSISNLENLSSGATKLHINLVLGIILLVMVIMG